MACVIGFAGYSGSGKTTLISRIVPLFHARGRKVAVIKHDAHGHYKEAAGADSTLFQKAGADAVVTISPHCVHHYVKQEDVRLKDVLASLAHMDYIFVEGFKTEDHPKLAVLRSRDQASIIEALDPKPLAIVAAFPFSYADVPVLNFHETEAIVGLIESRERFK